MKHTNLWREIEAYYDSPADQLWAAGMILMLLIAGALILWDPQAEDVEAMGQTAYEVWSKE